MATNVKHCKYLVYLSWTLELLQRKALSNVARRWTEKCYCYNLVM